MTEHSFRLKLDTGPDVVLWGLIGTGWYSITIGDTISFEARLHGGDLQVQGSRTLDGYASYDTITVESGGSLTISSGAIVTANKVVADGTLNVDGTLITYSPESVFRYLREYANFAGQFTTLRMADGDVRYSEQLPARSPVDTLLVGLEPEPGLQNRDVDGVWALVTNVADSRNASLTTTDLRLQLRVLATYSEYADHAAVRAALET